MYCKKCGKEIDEASKFCVNCGEPAKAVTTNKRSNRSLIITLVVVLALLVVGSVVALFATGAMGGSDPDRILATAERYLDDKEYDKAIIEFEKLLDIDNENIDAYLGLAEVYMAQEKYSKAIKQYENALDIDDQLVEAYLGIFDAYEAQEDTDEAIGILEKGIEALEDKKDIAKLEKRLEKLIGNTATEEAADTEEAGYEQDNNADNDVTDDADGSDISSETNGGILVEDDDNSSIEENGIIEMPELIGLTWDEAIAEYGSKLALVAQQEWSEYEKDVIFEQEFPEGRQIKIGTEVVVKVSKGIKLVEIQDLTGMTVDAAERQLKKDGFTVTKSYEENDDIEQGRIIRTEPSALEVAPQGSSVTLVVSLGGPNTLISVPKFVGLELETALVRCEEYHLVPIIEYVDSTEQEGTVIEQSIDEGEFVDRKTEITLKISTGEAPETTKKFSFTLPNSAEGEFRFDYYVDGILDAERSGEIYDVSLVDTIPYEISGSDGDVKELVIKVTSVKTGRTGVFYVFSFTFSADEDGVVKVAYSNIEVNKKIFAELNA